MTIGGAISDLNNLLKAHDIPIYYKPSIKKVIETIEQEPILDKIKAEINSPNRGTCDYFIVDRIEEIINKYRGESERV